MQPTIKSINEKKLVGQKVNMSFANDKTVELWKSFAARIKEVNNTVSADLFSVDIYNEPKFFTSFNPAKEFEKWAANEVNQFEDIPDGMEKLIIPQGEYAVFNYKGKPSQAQSTFQYIYGVWLPASEFEMDNRPYFARMGEKYKGENPESEEEFWIPVRKK